MFHPVSDKQGGETIHIPISEIKVNPGRRKADPEDIQELANSISELGLLNPITVDREHMLIAGLHRLEAAKLLGWTEIACTISSLEGLQAELAEIDENFVRRDLSGSEFGDLLLRRKEVYESLHPETKNGGDRRSEKIRNAKCNSDSETVKPFIQDTAEKLGVHPATVARQIQTAKNLTSETKEILRNSDTKITKKDALQLARLAPPQQEEAASRLAAGEIHSMAEYQPDGLASAQPPTVPYTLGNRRYATLEESIADMKRTDKDGSYTPDTLLADMDGFIQTFHKNFSWYGEPICTAVFPDISPVQFAYLQQRFGTVTDAIEKLIKQIKRSIPK